MKEQEVKKLLTDYLSDAGIDWQENLGVIRFRLSRDGMGWEMSCQCMESRILLYSQYPFQCEERLEASMECSRINRQLVQGAMFLTETGCPVFRTEAPVRDIYEASLSLGEAFRYNVSVIVRYWGRMSAYRSVMSGRKEQILFP